MRQFRYRWLEVCYLNYFIWSRSNQQRGCIMDNYFDETFDICCLHIERTQIQHDPNQFRRPWVTGYIFNMKQLKRVKNLLIFCHYSYKMLLSGPKRAVSKFLSTLILLQFSWCNCKLGSLLKLQLLLKS